MRGIIRTTLSVLLLAVVAAALCPAASPAPSPSAIDTIFAPLADAHSPGLAVLVRKDGKPVFRRGYGVRDLRTLAGIEPDSNFRLASVTKQFTAMAVMLLVHDGKLRYDQRLTDIFPDFPAYGRAITIRHLLTHTSGLADYEDLMVQTEKVRGRTWTADRQIRDDEVLHLLAGQRSAVFAPATSWAYSNSGYVVLGLVVAKVSGVPFGQFLRQRIFAPARMDATLVFENGKNNVPNRVFGHTRKVTGFVETDQSATSATLGDGGVYSNLDDLAKWDAALHNHALLGEEEWQAGQMPVKLADGSHPHWPIAPGDDNLHPGKPVAYGFGWFLDPYNGHARMWHTGGTVGFRTVIERFVEQRLTVIVLANRTDLDPEALAHRVAALYLP